MVHHTGEHTRTASTQRSGVDTRPLDSLPRGLKEEPLLRVHGQGLTRRDPEELGVELTCSVEKSAPPRVRRARPVRVGVEERGDVPASVGGEAVDAVATVRHQSPQAVRIEYSTRIAAAHTDDRDRVVRRHDIHGRVVSGAGLVPERLREDERGQVRRGRIVEDQGGREVQPRRSREPVA